MSKKLILSVSSYDFENKKGEHIKGAKITYINKKNTKKQGVTGVTPIVLNCNADILTEIKEVPGLYDIELEEVQNKDFKGANLMITDLDFIKPIDVSLLFQ